MFLPSDASDLDLAEQLWGPFSSWLAAAQGRSLEQAWLAKASRRAWAVVDCHREKVRTRYDANLRRDVANQSTYVDYWMNTCRHMMRTYILPHLDMASRTLGEPNSHLRVAELCCAPGGFAQALMEESLLPVTYLGITLPEACGGLGMRLPSEFYADEFRASGDPESCTGFIPVWMDVNNINVQDLESTCPMLHGRLHDLVLADGAWSGLRVAEAVAMKLKQVAVCIRVLRAGGTMVCRGRATGFWVDLLAFFLLIFDEVLVIKPSSGVSMSMRTNNFCFYVLKGFQSEVDLPSDMFGARRAHTRDDIADILQTWIERVTQADVRQAWHQSVQWIDWRIVSSVTGPAVGTLMDRFRRIRRLHCFADALKSALMSILLPEALYSRLDWNRIQETCFQQDSTTFVSWGPELGDPILRLGEIHLKWDLSVIANHAGRPDGVPVGLAKDEEMSLATPWTDPACCVQLTCPRSANAGSSLNSARSLQQRISAMESLNAFFDLLGADEAGDETYSVILLFAGKPTSCPRQCLCRANLLRGVTADLGGALLATVNLTTPSALSLRSEGIRERHLQSLSSWSERDVESRRRAALRALLTDKADICPEISTLIVDEELPVRELQTEVQTEVYPVILYGTLTCILQSIIALYAPDSLRIRGIHAGLNANSLAPI